MTLKKEKKKEKKRRKSLICSVDLMFGEKLSMVTNNKQRCWACKNSGMNSWAQGWVDGIRERARNDVWYSSRETG